MVGAGGQPFIDLGVAHGLLPRPGYSASGLGDWVNCGR